MRLQFLLAAVLVFTAAVPALAQEVPLLVVNVSEETYTEGDVVVVSGRVTTVVPGTPVIIQIIYGDTNIIDVTQTTPAEDGSFIHTVLAQGNYWKREGEYTARALYGPENISEASFRFVAKQQPVEDRIEGNFEVGTPDGASTVYVWHAVTGGTVSDMAIDQDRFSLVVTVDSPKPRGELTVGLPRDSIDARSGGCDGEDTSYIVRIDDVQVPYRELDETGSGRVIAIEFNGGDQDIEIIGTCVIPEFGGVAAAVLAAAVVSIVALSKRFPANL